GRDKEIAIQQDFIQEGQDQLDSQVSGFLSKFMSAGSGGYGGGKCYPDKQISIAGRTVQLPFSQICDPLIILRYGLLAAAYLAAARILSKETT
ncbi:virulence factor TspB C-terminal domain-related protein, partial [Pseudomonas syringae]